MANIITELHLEMSDNWYVSKKLNSVGRVGENTVTKLIIEPTEILDNVTYEIEIADASGSKNVAELTIDGTELYLILTANMLTTSGIMKMQVRGLFTDGSIKKSNIFELKVNRSISATEHYEEYAVTIFDQLVQDCRDIIEGAESYAIRAETAAVNAEAYEQSASASAEAASASEATATSASTAAVNAAASAESASAAAHTSAETATTAANSASASASTAQTSAQTATSASVTAQSASEVAQTASTAATSAATSAENSATSATTAANNASASASNAATSATAASNSATSASTSASNAATSETNAASSAASASTSAANASTSATNAANSASAAATSATNAHNSEVNASTSETNASTSATEAAASAESIAASAAQINENTYRINDLEAIIAGYQQADLPTGAIASVTDGTALLMPSLKIGIEPVQDLHGYDHPWAGGAGKNKCNAQNPIVLSQAGNIGEQPCAISAGTYTFSWTSSANAAISLTLWNGSTQIGTFASPNSIQGRGNLTFTITENATYLKCYFNSATTVSDIQVESGSTATSYEPYSNICPISGWTETNVNVSGVNIWDEEWEEGTYDINTGKPSTYSVYWRSKNMIPVNPLQTYYFKTSSDTIWRFMYDKNKQYINYLGGIRDNSWKIPENVYYINFVNVSRNVYNPLTNPMSINYPSTDTEYHAYNGTTYTIEFKDGDNPLTVYGGTLDVTSGELVVDRAEVDLGTLTWERSSAEHLYSSGLSDSAKTYPDGVANKVIFEQYQSKPSKRGGYYPGEPNVISLNANGNLYSVSKTAPTGQCVYELATPITYHLTPTQVRTLVGNNNIWADTGDILEGKYFKSLV